MQKIVPFLWFDRNAEEAMNFYVSVFKNSKVLSVTRYGEAGPGAEGSGLFFTLQPEGLGLLHPNGGSPLQFPPAICPFWYWESPHENDAALETLSSGGR